MMKRLVFVCSVLLISCGKKAETTKPVVSGISESIYASGTVKSDAQYQAFATVSGIIQDILVSEGDTVKKGAAILTIVNDAQRLSKENAALAASFASLDANQGKLHDAQQMTDLARSKMKNDSSLYFRQLNLWQQNIGSKVELEQRELAYQNAKSAYYSARVKYDDLKRQLMLNAEQSQKSYEISSKLASDFTLRSEIDGIVYQLPKKKGELVSPQTPLAVIGSASNFILEMQVDEYDILKVEKGQKVMVTMDSYKGKVFDALVTKIDPIMNERSKTFLVEAMFVVQPKLLYPNVSFEANIILQTKDKALLIPRSYVINDSFVLKSNGDKAAVKTGLKDYKMIEIVSGITAEDELKKPTE
ncbi:MAG: efflux RND transporter periplasmic adaptor subunit [Chitinophagaceae bacterium]|jgi:multidrug efflux pump subunit AcrA (membrane-fusion protein)